MYDSISGAATHEVASRWFTEYHAKHFMPRGPNGQVNGATMYFDPVEDHNHIIDASMGLGVAW